MARCTEFSDVRKVERNPSPTEQQIRTALFQDVLEATTRNYKATREFEEVMGQFPSGLPHPDGVQRIKNASNKLTIARKEMATAHNRLNEYLSRGIVPDDLKRMLIDHWVTRSAPPSNEEEVKLSRTNSL